MSNLEFDPDQIEETRNYAIKTVLDKYREIDERGSYTNGLEIACALFGQDVVDSYLNSLHETGKADTINTHNEL